MIKTAGANVSPSEIEQAIAAVISGTGAYVFGLPDPDRGQIVVAVIAMDTVDVDEAALRPLARRALRHTRFPKRFAFVPASEVPLLASGKPDVQRMNRLFDA